MKNEKITSPLKNIDEYIAMQAIEIQPKLELMRQTIHAASPSAEEVISYSMPAFKYHGIVVYFAACKNHIGFYPTGAGVDVFKDDVKGYKTSKGTIQFPNEDPLPLELITKIVKYRTQQNLEKAELKRTKKKKALL